MGSWHRGNDGRLVARGGHQRGILSVRSRKVDLANKRAGHHPVKKHSFILSLPRGLSLARLVRGDKSCYRQKNGDLPLSVSFPLSDGEDLEMTDLYELLVKMSLCEEEAMQQEQQFEALSLPCVEIDMQDEIPAVFQREATPPPESSSEPASISSSATSSASSSPVTTPEVDSQGETAKDGPSREAETEAEVKAEQVEPDTEEEPASEQACIMQEQTEASTAKPTTPPQSLLNILHPLHQSTPLDEADLATILNWLLQPDIFSHLSVQSSSAKSFFTAPPKDDDGSPFPSTDHFLQIMEVISQLTAKVLMKPSSVDAEVQEKGRVEITAEHLSVIMNLRLLLDYAARVLCIRSIETQNNNTSTMGANANARQVA